MIGLANGIGTFDKIPSKQSHMAWAEEFQSPAFLLNDKKAGIAPALIYFINFQALNIKFFNIISNY